MENSVQHQRDHPSRGNEKQMRTNPTSVQQGCAVRLYRTPHQGSILSGCLDNHRAGWDGNGRVAMLLCSALYDGDCSNAHCSQPPPSKSVRVGQSENFRVLLGSLVHLQHQTVRAFASVLAVVAFSQKVLNKGKTEHPCPPCQALGAPDAFWRQPARESIHHAGDCCAGCMASWDSAHHTRAACLAPRLSLSEYPLPALGLMLATTEIACILACGILGWGLGMRPSCRCS